MRRPKLPARNADGTFKRSRKSSKRTRRSNPAAKPRKGMYALFVGGPSGYAGQRPNVEAARVAAIRLAHEHSDRVTVYRDAKRIFAVEPGAPVRWYVQP